MKYKHPYRLFRLRRIFPIFIMLPAFLAAASDPVLAVFYSRGTPKRNVLQWDCPVFAAYSENIAIWRTNGEESIEALMAAKSDNVRDAVSYFGVVISKYSGKTFNLVDGMDSDETILWFQKKVVCIKGDWRKPYRIEIDGREDAQTLQNLNERNDRNQKLWGALPSDLRQVLSSVYSFDVAGASRWIPDQIMIRLVPGGETVGCPVELSSDVQRLLKPLSQKKEILWAELPGEKLEGLLKIIAINEKPRAIDYQGKKMHAQVFIEFPGESAWRTRAK